MNEVLLPQPTVPGKATGIISTDPWQQQCGECGAVDTKPDNRGVAIWLILARWVFCLAEASPIRRCRDCMAAHKETCERCRRT